MWFSTDIFIPYKLISSDIVQDGNIMNGKTRTSDIASLQNILDATSSSIQIIGPEGVYIDCNAATYAMFHANTVEDIIGKPPSFLSPEKQRNGTDSNEGAAQFIQMAFSGEVVSFEWEHKRLDGSIFPCQVTLQLIEYEGKTCLMATIVDISDMVALRHKSEFIIANAPTPIIDLKPDLSITYANHAFAVLTDKSIEEIQKMKVTDFDVRNRAGGSLAEGIETKSTVHGIWTRWLPVGLSIFSIITRHFLMKMVTSSRFLHIISIRQKRRMQSVILLPSLNSLRLEVLMPG